MAQIMGIDLTDKEYIVVQKVLRAYSIKEYDEKKRQQAEKTPSPKNTKPDLWRRLDIDFRFYSALKRSVDIKGNLELKHLRKIANGEMKIKNVGVVGVEQIRQVLAELDD